MYDETPLPVNRPAPSQSAHGTFQGSVLKGLYRVNSLLSRGGMGALYVAREVHSGDPLIIKVPRKDLVALPGVRDRFLMECVATKRVQHPAVVEVRDMGEWNDGELYLVMEYVPGPSLAKLIAGKKLSLTQSIEIALDVAQGLAAAHRVDVLHRDLKPENILIPRKPTDSRAKIIDFGLARLLDSPRITTSDQILGTPCYMSPENTMGNRKLDRRTDIYSFGVILYEMLSFKLPYTGRTVDEVVASARKKNPMPLHELPGTENVSRSLTALVMTCLEKSPSNRPGNMDDIVSILEVELANLRRC